MRVLVTRPEPDCARTVRTLAARGHEAVPAPVLAVHPVAATLPAGPFAATAFTSANAARVAAALPGIDDLRRRPAFAVGGRTAEALAEAGFGDVAAAEGDVVSLAALVAARLSPGAAVLHLSGREVAGDLVGDLGRRGLAARRLVVYEARPVARLPEAARRALAGGRLDAALVYSQRSAATLVALAGEAAVMAPLGRLRFAAMSRAAAEPLHPAGVDAVAVAPRPEEGALLDTLDTLDGRAAPPGGLATGGAKRV